MNTPRFTLFVLTSTLILPSSSFQPARIPKTLLAAPSIRSIELFPSDDSDYESAERSEMGRLEIFVKKSGGEEVSQPTQSRLEIGTVSIVDPVDVIADWVAERFAENSLQSKSMNADFSNENGEAYVLESYSSGSALNAIARASHPYIPLSYQIRTIVRVLLPSLVFAAFGIVVYPSMAQFLVHLPSDSIGGGPTSNNLLYTDEVLTVLSNDLSQYVQNILTTCALLFGMLVSNTYCLANKLFPIPIAYFKLLLNLSGGANLLFYVSAARTHLLCSVSRSNRSQISIRANLFDGLWS